MLKMAAKSTDTGLMRRGEAVIPIGYPHGSTLFAERALGSRDRDIEGTENLDFCGGLGGTYSAPDLTHANVVGQNAIHRGLLIMTASGNVIRALMPLTISNEDLQEGLGILRDAAR